MSKPTRTKLHETAKNYSRNDQVGKILHCQHIRQGLADEVNLFEEMYEYGGYSHCDMAPDRDQPPVTNYAPVLPLGWDACGVSARCNSTFSRRSEKKHEGSSTHVGRKDVQKACISWDRLTALFTVKRHYAQWAVSPLRWGLVVLLGRYQDHVVAGRI